MFGQVQLQVRFTMLYKTITGCMRDFHPVMNTCGLGFGDVTRIWNRSNGALIPHAVPVQAPGKFDRRYPESRVARKPQRGVYAIIKSSQLPGLL